MSERILRGGVEKTAETSSFSGLSQLFSGLIHGAQSAGFHMPEVSPTISVKDGMKVLDMKSPVRHHLKQPENRSWIQSIRHREPLTDSQIRQAMHLIDFQLAAMKNHTEKQAAQNFSHIAKQGLVAHELQTALKPHREDNYTVYRNVEIPKEHASKIVNEDLKILAGTGNRMYLKHLRTLASQVKNEEKPLLQPPPPYIDKNSVLGKHVWEKYSSDLARLIAEKQPFSEKDVKKVSLINHLFGGNFITPGELAEAEKSEWGLHQLRSNIRRGIAIIEWIYHEKRHTEWSPEEEKYWLSDQIKFTKKQIHQLRLAVILHQIVRENEISQNPDDDRAFTDGIQAVVDANTHNGVEDQDGILDDLEYFFIDQGNGDSLGKMVQEYSHFRSSNAAYNLFGGPRIGAVGWKSKYWDYNNPKKNQAHHFIGYFSITIRPGGKEKEKSKTYKNEKNDSWAFDVVDAASLNIQDVRLGLLAKRWAERVKSGKVSWKNFPEQLYRSLSDKYDLRKK